MPSTIDIRLVTSAGMAAGLIDPVPRKERTIFDGAASEKQVPRVIVRGIVESFT